MDDRNWNEFKQQSWTNEKLLTFREYVEGALGRGQKDEVEPLLKFFGQETLDEVLKGRSLKDIREASLNNEK